MYGYKNLSINPVTKLNARSKTNDKKKVDFQRCSGYKLNCTFIKTCLFKKTLVIITLTTKCDNTFSIGFS